MCFWLLKPIFFWRRTRLKLQPYIYLDTTDNTDNLTFVAGPLKCRINGIALCNFRDKKMLLVRWHGILWAVQVAPRAKVNGVTVNLLTVSLRKYCAFEIENPYIWYFSSDFVDFHTILSGRWCIIRWQFYRNANADRAARISCYVIISH